MAKGIKIGQQDYTTTVFIPDPASTDGSGKTGLVAANLTVSYTRVETDNDVTVTDVTSSLNNLSALTDSHADWGLKEVSSTLAPGLYRLDIADAVFATGAWSAVVYVMITSSAAAASPIEFVMVPELPYDGVKAASIANNAITAAAINADAITAAKIADDAFSNEHFAAGALTSSEITSAAGCAVTSIANNAITTLSIADGAITDAKVADNVKVDVNTIKTQAINCAAGVTVLANVGFAGAPGASNGAPTTNGTKINQTVDLTAGQSIACSDKTGFSLSAGGVDAILDEVVDNTATMRQILMLALAVLAGKSAGGGTATITFRDHADSKNRVTATVDADGNRTAVSLNVT